MASQKVSVGAQEIQTKPDIEALLRQLLNCINGSSPSGSFSPEDVDGKEVVLDVRLDGVQYTLIRTSPRSLRPPVSLSPRESEIVRLVAKGLPNKAIATVLDISPWTVATHLRRVFAKLGVNSRAAMVACMLKGDLFGIIKPCQDSSTPR